MAGRRRAARRDQTRADGRGVARRCGSHGAIAAHVKSNAVIFTGLRRHARDWRGPDEPGGRGEGRGDEGRQASWPGSVAASDAFFPFRDGLDALAGAGATAVVQPGGSVRDAEVIAAADEHGLAMVFTGMTALSALRDGAFFHRNAPIGAGGR